MLRVEAGASLALLISVVSFAFARLCVILPVLLVFVGVISEFCEMCLVVAKNVKYASCSKHKC